MKLIEYTLGDQTLALHESDTRDSYYVSLNNKILTPFNLEHLQAIDYFNMTKDELEKRAGILLESPEVTVYLNDDDDAVDNDVVEAKLPQEKIYFTFNPIERQLSRPSLTTNSREDVVDWYCNQR